MAGRCAEHLQAVQVHTRYFHVGAAVWAVSAALLSLALMATVSQAHGGLDDPPTRSYVCRFLDYDGEMCAEAWRQNPQALYDWMEINIGDAGGVHQPRIPDGQLCSAGRSKYSALDTPGDWPVTTLSPDSNGLYPFGFIPHAPHATEYFRFYITREGFDATTDSLNWSDLELVHDSGPISYTSMASQGNDFGFQVSLPERPGRHILYLIWQRSDSQEAFYGCSDIQFASFTDAEPSSPADPTDPPSTPDEPENELPDPPDDSHMHPDDSEHMSDLVVNLSVSSDWGAGYCADGQITNHGNTESLWQTTLLVSGELTSYWDSTFTAEGDTQALDQGVAYTVEGEAWNRFLQPHTSASFGFCVDRSSASSEIASVIQGGENAQGSGQDSPPEDNSSEETSDTGSVDDNPSSDPNPPSESAQTPPDSGGTESTPATSLGNTKPILAAYYPEWGIYGRNYFIADIPATSLTHVIYAFVDLNSDGEIVLFDAWAAVQRPFGANQSVSGTADGSSTSGSSSGVLGNFGQIEQLKSLYPHLRFSIAVGGWTLSQNFSSVLSTADGRERAAESVTQFLTQYEMFDGVDFDWEYPGGGGLSGNSELPEDGLHYALFLERVREKLDVLGQGRNRVYEISVASPGGSDKIANFNLEGLEDVVDFFNVMTYDFHGAWESVTGHLAAFEADPNGYDVRSAVELYLDAGVPPEKIVLGVPLYGRAWAGVADNGDGGYAEVASGAAPGSFPDQAGVFDYKDLLSRLRDGVEGWSMYWDDPAGAAYLYSPNLQVFSSFETPGTVAFKAEWAQWKGLRGMMFWDLSSDLAGDPESLVDTAADSWFGGLEWDEIVATSELQFDQIIGGNQLFDPFVESETSPSDITQIAPDGSPAQECSSDLAASLVQKVPVRDWNQRSGDNRRMRFRPPPRGWRPPRCATAAP